jgi:hypothetical protein
MTRPIERMVHEFRIRIGGGSPADSLGPAGVRTRPYWPRVTGPCEPPV